MPNCTFFLSIYHSLQIFLCLQKLSTNIPPKLYYSPRGPALLPVAQASYPGPNTQVNKEQ